MAKGNGKDKKDDRLTGAFEREPQAKGGRKRKHLIHPVSPNSLANLAKRNVWQPGKSANPGGKPRQHRELVDFWRCRNDEIDGYILDLARKGAEGKLTNSDKIWSAHLWAIKEFMFGRNPQSVMVTGGFAVGDADAVDGSGVHALLMRARLENAKKQVTIEDKSDE